MLMLNMDIMDIPPPMDTRAFRNRSPISLVAKSVLPKMEHFQYLPNALDTMVDIIHVFTDMDTDILERDPLMLNPRLNLRLALMLNMDTMDIHPPMDFMVDIIPVLTDMDTTDTEFLERDQLMQNLNPNITTIDTTITDTIIGDTMVDS